MREFNRGWGKWGGCPKRAELAIGRLRLCDSSSLLIPPLLLRLGQREINGLKENMSEAR